MSYYIKRRLPNIRGTPVPIQTETSSDIGVRVLSRTVVVTHFPTIYLLIYVFTVGVKNVLLRFINFVHKKWSFLLYVLVYFFCFTENPMKERESIRYRPFKLKVHPRPLSFLSLRQTIIRRLPRSPRVIE